MSKSNTKYTSQHIDNQSFDEGLQVRVTELIGADGILKNPATEEKQDSIVSAIQNITIPAPEGGATEVNQETLISLIGTLQELCQRLAPLAAAMNSGAPGLRVTPNAATLPVSGTVTATVASTVVSSLTNFGTGIPASEMAHDMNNMTAVLANINNVTQ